MTKLLINVYYNGDKEPYGFTQEFDRAGIETILVGFGNGIWDEMRVVADNEDALNIMRRILASGGYSLSEQPFSGNHLYQQGDECWQGFVFIDPQPRPQDFE